MIFRDKNQVNIKAKKSRKISFLCGFFDVNDSSNFWVKLRKRNIVMVFYTVKALIP